MLKHYFKLCTKARSSFLLEAKPIVGICRPNLSLCSETSLIRSFSSGKSGIRSKSTLSDCSRLSNRFNRSNRSTKSSTAVKYRSICNHSALMPMSEGSFAGKAGGKRQILPTNVRPINYSLSLEPDFTKFTFEGTVSIDLDVKETSSSISLNVLEIDIHSVEVESTTTQTPSKTEYDSDSQSVTFELSKPLEEGSKAKITIKFTGQLNDKLAGFYRSVHTDENGKTRIVATTQMEPTDCRRAFPCFDEPSVKATFDVSLIADPSLTALSNMDVKSESTLASGKKVTTFNRTPIMSTYLVAFIIGELDYVESNLFRVPVRVYATPGMLDRCQFSADLGARTLQFFESKFDVPYPLPKMDMVGIHDFSAGAMENWGLVTYRVVDLLFDEESDGADTKQRVAEVVQHELAHQWFGNLVTMEWWDGLWLNEGFATWMSWFSCNQFYPDWKVWETYVGDNLQSSLSLDGLRSSHPVQVPVQRADEINQIFDAISYSKGSSIVKMLSNFLGEDVFIKGISRYLKEHKYGNTKTSDLWKALSEESGKDVLSVMDVWTTKVGYPVVTVSEKTTSDGKLDITVQQNRFLTTGDVKPEEDLTLYPLGLGLRTRDSVDDSLTLNERSTSFTVNDDFYKLNANQSGLYRVSYPLERIEKLSKSGTEGLLSVEDRVGLVADTAALATSGYQKTSALLSLVSAWRNETETNVWGELVSRLNVIISAWMFEPEPTRKALNKLVADIVLPKAKEVGWNFKPTDSLLEQQLKSLLFRAAVKVKSQEFLDLSLKLFEKYTDGDSKAIHPNLKDAVFVVAGQNGGEKAWKDLLAIYKSPKSSVEGLAALRALGRNPDPEIKKKTLNLALDGTVRTQDVSYVLSGLTSDADSVELLWTWFKENWTKISSIYPASLGMLSRVVSIVSGQFTTKKQLDDFVAFFADKDTKGYDQAMAITKDRVQAKISWIERDSKDVEQWLEKNGYSK